jgi:hypothetical protein
VVIDGHNKAIDGMEADMAMIANYSYMENEAAKQEG